MDIDDILEEKEFGKLNEYLDSEMMEHAGEYLIGRMQEVLGGDYNNSRNWFYSKNAFGERPYDICKEGGSEEVCHILGRIEQGVF